MKLKERLKAPVVPLIKKVQKVCTAIAGTGAATTAYIKMAHPEMDIPGWVPVSIVIAWALNHFILQLTKPEDFKMPENGSENAGTN